MGSLVLRERDNESDFGGEVLRGCVQKAYDSCRGGTGLEDLIVHSIDDEASVWLDPLCEEGSKELLR